MYGQINVKLGRKQQLIAYHAHRRDRPNSLYEDERVEAQQGAHMQ